MGNHYPGNHRNMSFKEEAELFKPFEEEAGSGQLVEASAILAAYEAKMGRSFEKDHGRMHCAGRLKSAATNIQKA